MCTLCSREHNEFELCKQNIFQYSKWDKGRIIKLNEDYRKYYLTWVPIFKIYK